MTAINKTNLMISPHSVTGETQLQFTSPNHMRPYNAASVNETRRQTLIEIAAPQLSKPKEHGANLAIHNSIHISACAIVSSIQSFSACCPQSRSKRIQQSQNFRDELFLWALLHLDEVLTVSPGSDLGRKATSIIILRLFY